MLDEYAEEAPEIEMFLSLFQDKCLVNVDELSA
jgi:hypothetical protein